jgi:hypothetical protein
MATLKDLSIAGNVSEPVRIDGTRCAIRVTTTEASTITVERSIDGANFSLVSDFSLAVDNTSDEFNLVDVVFGQWLKVKSTGEMTVCKILF